MNIKTLEDAFIHTPSDTRSSQKQIVPAKGTTIARLVCGLGKHLVETKRQVQEAKKGSALDVVLISEAQKIEHYEIANCLAEIAKKLGHMKAAKLLTDILEEEKANDEISNRIMPIRPYRRP